MKKISRRDFLKVTGLVGAAAALTACGGSASSTAASTASSAAGSAAASTAALGADTQAIVDRGVLKVGVKNAVQGFSFQDTLTGEYKGLEDSLAEMIAEHLGVDVEFTTVTAATRGELLDSGDIDAVHRRAQEDLGLLHPLLYRLRFRSGGGLHRHQGSG